MLLYWRHTEIYPSTDNAYTGANIVRVAAQVTGPIAHVYVVDDDKVAAGDPLFDIDPTLYDAALRNARAQFDAAASAAGRPPKTSKPPQTSSSKSVSRSRTRSANIATPRTRRRAASLPRKRPAMR